MFLMKFNFPKPRPAGSVYPVKYLYGKELVIKYTSGIYGRNMLGIRYLFNRIKCEAYVTRGGWETSRFSKRIVMKASGIILLHFVFFLINPVFIDPIP